MKDLDVETLKSLKEIEEKYSAKLNDVYSEYLGELDKYTHKVHNDILIPVIFLPAFYNISLLIISGSRGNSLDYECVANDILSSLKLYLDVYNPKNRNKPSH